MRPKKYTYKELKNILKPSVEALARSNEFYSSKKVPFDGKVEFGARELIRRVLHKMITMGGRFSVDNIDVGLAISFRGYYGLQSTHLAALRSLFDRLVRDIGRPVAQNIIARWERTKSLGGFENNQGNIKKQFMGETFKGFE